MVCSPSTLFVDVTLWVIPQVADNLKRSYQMLSKGELYDCGLTSVPCDNNITKALINSDPTLSFWFDLIVVYIILTMSVLLGIVGNVFNIVIFSRNKIVSDSTNNLILALSVSDLINLSCIAALMTSFYLCHVDEAAALTVFNIIYPHNNVITRWFSLLSLDFVTVIAIQRVVAVIFPFKISTIFSLKKTNFVIAVLFVLCLCTMLPMNANLHPRWVLHPYFQKYIPLGVFLKLELDFVIRYSFYYFNFRSGANLFSIFISGFVTIHMLNRQAKNRATLKADNVSDPQTSKQKTSVREAKAIKMSLAICFITITIYSIAISVNGIRETYAEELFKSPLSSVSEYSLLSFISFNSFFNFFLYLRMSDKYRDVLYSKFKYLYKKSRD